MDKILKPKQYGDIVIRPLKVDDLKYLPDLYKEYYTGNTGIETDYNKMVKNFVKLQDCEHMSYIGIEKDNKIIGFAHIVLNEDIVGSCESFVTAWTLRVAPNERGKGYGKALLNYIEQYAKDKNADFVAFSSDKANTNANALYRKSGYEEDCGWFKEV